jgi:prophage regulatory protein
MKTAAQAELKPQLDAALDRVQSQQQRLERFLRRGEVESVTGLGRSTIYQKMAEGTFPKAVPISGGAVGWLESEIAAWQAKRIAERDAGQSRP